MALQQCGTNNIAEVQKFLPDKTITDIRLAFEHYSALAAEKMNHHEKLREEDSAINRWIKVVKKAHDNSNGVVDVIPRALKYIALFEKRPHDKDVNLRECYMTLSEMSNGMVAKTLSPTTNCFFFENLSMLALKLKKDENNKKKHFIRNLKNVDDLFKAKMVKTYNNRKKNKSNVILNPLNIPNDLLEADKDND